MSKTTLKKELSKLDKEQLIQIVLDVYSARKEAKAYFEFFLNPDLTSLFDKYKEEVNKEMNRGKYTKSTARISRVRTLIKDFASYSVPPESVIELMIYTLKVGLLIDQRKYVSEPFVKGLHKLAFDIRAMGDANELFTSTMALLEEALSGVYGYIGMVNRLRLHLGMSMK